jgi:tetratricopeptide (TPR) repeat protein
MAVVETLNIGQHLHVARLRRDTVSSHRASTAMLGVVAALSSFVAVPGVSAQQAARDKVTLQLEGASSRTIITCTVLDYTGESITIRTRSNLPARSYPAAQVVEVQTAQTEPHMRGLEKFAAADLAGAAAAFEQALREETRDWVRRDILAMLIHCAYRTGDYATAGTRFLVLFESDPQTRHFHLLPLWWTAAPPDAAHENAARGWLIHDSPLARLIGASALLTAARHASSAEAELHRLSGSGADYRVHLLAQLQLWRLRLNAGDLGREELSRWQSRIDALPDGLQGGPYYVLGQAHLRLREHEPAAAALLRVPLVHDADHFLAARACLEAADALAAAGQDSHAATLYREVVERFGTTPFAIEAKQSLGRGQ